MSETDLSAIKSLKAKGIGSDTAHACRERETRISHECGASEEQKISPAGHARQYSPPGLPRAQNPVNSASAASTSPQASPTVRRSVGRS